MSPFPSSLPIHPDWSAHHQPTMTSTLTGRIVISHPGESSWSPTTGPVVGAVGATLYDGPFRAQALMNAAGETDAALQPITVTRYLIVIPADSVAVLPGSIAVVRECPDDSELVNKTFVIIGAGYGSRRFERDLFADLDLSNPTEAAT